MSDQDANDLLRLVSESSFGTPAARALRKRIDPQRARKVREDADRRVKQPDEQEEVPQFAGRLRVVDPKGQPAKRKFARISNANTLAVVSEALRDCIRISNPGTQQAAIKVLNENKKVLVGLLPAGIERSHAIEVADKHQRAAIMTDLLTMYNEVQLERVKQQLDTYLTALGIEVQTQLVEFAVANLRRVDEAMRSSLDEFATTMTAQYAAIEEFESSPGYDQMVASLDSRVQNFFDFLEHLRQGFVSELERILSGPVATLTETAPRDSERHDPAEPSLHRDPLDPDRASEFTVEDISVGPFAHGSGRLADGRLFAFRVLRRSLHVEVYRDDLDHTNTVPDQEDIVAVAAAPITGIDLNDERGIIAVVRDLASSAEPIERADVDAADDGARTRDR